MLKVTYHKPEHSCGFPLAGVEHFADRAAAEARAKELRAQGFCYVEIARTFLPLTSTGNPATALNDAYGI